MTTEIELTARRLQEAAEHIADHARIVKEIADQLRSDVDALTERVVNLEEETQAP